MTDMKADAIVVGGGPSGVAAAIEMKRAGVRKVTLLEREAHLGGATRHCSHSPFGMLEFGRVYFGAAYGKRLEREAQAHGIDIRYGHSVARLGEDGELLVSNHRGVETLKADRVLVTTGAREKPRSVRMLTGDRPIGVITTGTLQSYTAFHGIMPFRRPVIVGSELVTLSSILTCLSHGARPAAVVEEHSHALAKAPLTWFPSMVGIPFHLGAQVVDILGKARVEAVRIRKHDGSVDLVECDGLLLTGRFTPESSLFLNSVQGIDNGSGGPEVDQSGRCRNPIYFAAGNVLRAVETGGWAFREGRAIGRAMAADLNRGPAEGTPISVSHDAAIKLVVPNLMRRDDLAQGGLERFQLRFPKRARGELTLMVDGKEAWRKAGSWMPERRVLVPFPANVSSAQHIHFGFREEA